MHLDAIICFLCPRAQKWTMCCACTTASVVPPCSCRWLHTHLVHADEYVAAQKGPMPPALGMRVFRTPFSEPQSRDEFMWPPKDQSGVILGFTDGDGLLHGAADWGGYRKHCCLAQVHWDSGDIAVYRCGQHGDCFLAYQDQRYVRLLDANLYKPEQSEPCEEQGSTRVAPSIGLEVMRNPFSKPFDAEQDKIWPPCGETGTIIGFTDPFRVCHGQADSDRWASLASVKWESLGWSGTYRIGFGGDFWLAHKDPHTGTSRVVDADEYLAQVRAQKGEIIVAAYRASRFSTAYRYREHPEFGRQARELLLSPPRNRSDLFRVIHSRFASKAGREGIEEAFKIVDDDMTGKISFRNLKRIARELGKYG